MVAVLSPAPPAPATPPDYVTVTQSGGVGPDHSQLVVVDVVVVVDVSVVVVVPVHVVVTVPEAVVVQVPVKVSVLESVVVSVEV
ncbi:hypothetical protein GCM10027167_49110 [Nocardia heshunensis]